MKKCAQLMLRVAVFLRAVRTLDLDIISTSSPCDGIGLTHFASFFALLRVVPELSASFSSFRALTTVSARGLRGVPESPGV